MSNRYLKYSLPFNKHGISRGFAFYIRFAGTAIFAASVTAAFTLVLLLYPASTLLILLSFCCVALFVKRFNMLLIGAAGILPEEMYAEFLEILDRMLESEYETTFSINLKLALVLSSLLIVSVVIKLENLSGLHGKAVSAGEPDDDDSATEKLRKK